MYSILIVVHVIISLFLIAVILLQAGKGGGLADSFGGSQMQNLFGTKSTTVLTRLTAVCAIGFIVTCVSLAVISSRQVKSIVDSVKMPQAAATETQAAVPQEENVPLEAQTPLAASSAAPVEPAAQGGAETTK